MYTTARKEWGMEHLANPVAAMKLPVVRNEKERRIYAHEEEELLKRADPEMKLIIGFAIATAMRRSEILALRWEDVSETVARLRDTKNGRDRAVPLSKRARSFLPERSTGKIFKLHGDTITHRFHDLAKECGFEGMSFHSTRHEATSRLFEKGLSIMEVATITGHRSLSMLQRYTHLQMSSLLAKLD